MAKTTHRMMLAALLKDDRLEEPHRSAFQSMYAKLELGHYRDGLMHYRDGLSRPQAQYIEDFYKKFELEEEAGSMNLFSNGKVPLGFKMPKRDFETMSKPCPECKRLVNSSPGPQHAMNCTHYHQNEKR